MLPAYGSRAFNTVNPYTRKENQNMETTLNKNVLRDYALHERINRLFRRWESRVREFRMLDFRRLREMNRRRHSWQLVYWECDKYKAACKAMTDEDLRKCSNV